MGGIRLFAARNEAVAAISAAGKRCRVIVSFLRLLSGILQLVFLEVMERLFLALGLSDPENIDYAALASQTPLLLRVFIATVAFFLLSFCLEAVQADYSMRIAKGEPSGWAALGKSFLGFLRALPAAILLLVLIYAASLAVSIVLVLNTYLGLLFSLMIGLAAVFLLYAYRLYLQTLADRKELNFLSAARKSRRISKGCRGQLVFLDLSFFWFPVLLGLVMNVVSGFPASFAQLGTTYGFPALSTLIEANQAVLTPVFRVLSLLATLPLCYWMEARISVAYAKAYLMLRDPPVKDESHPLAYALVEDEQS